MAAAQATVLQNSAFSNVARITSSTGGYMVAADVSALVYRVWEEMTGTVTTTGSTLQISTTFSTLTSSSVVWPVDTTGYNFKHDVDGSVIPSADTTYVIEYEITPASGSRFFEQFTITTSVTKAT